MKSATGNEIRRQLKQFRGSAKIDKPMTIKMKSIKYGPDGLTARATVARNGKYITTLQYPEAKPHEEGNVIAIRGGKKIPVKVSMQHLVKCRCSCPDFRYTFSEPLKGKKSLYGQPFDFSDVKGTGKPRNPKKYYGCCQHVLGLMSKMTST